MRKVVYYVAVTADGFIARRDGTFDVFLQDGPHLADLIALFPETIPGHLRETLGVRDANRRFDTVLMGRRTYQVGLDQGIDNPYPHLEQHVFSQTLALDAKASVAIAAGAPLPYVEKLK